MDEKKQLKMPVEMTYGTGDRKYLTMFGKIGYGIGDSAWCCISCLISSFMLIYLTDVAGLNAAIVGTLMMVARLFDGVSDVIFGRILDKTNTKMGKARPWMFGSIFGAAISLVAVFAIPTSWGSTAQYTYFFIFYMLSNTVFYTSGYISYSTLMSLITKNNKEQVQITGYRTIAGNLSYMIMGSVTLGAAAALGGGLNGWRNLAIIYGILAIVINTISVFSVKELPEEEVAGGADVKSQATKDNLKTVLPAVLKCKYFYLILGAMVLCYSFATIFQTSAAYYATYVLGNPDLLSTLVIVNYGVTMACAFFVPLVVKKMDVWKVNLTGMGIALVGRLLCTGGGTAGMLGIILSGIAVATIGTAVFQTTSYPLMASTAEYIRRKSDVSVGGVVFSCSSMGIKVGSGLGSAICGILLNIGGYVANAAEQPASAIGMLKFMFLWFPVLITVGLIVLLYFMDVDKALEKKE